MLTGSGEHRLSQGSLLLLSLIPLMAFAINPFGFDTAELPRVTLVKVAAVTGMVAWIASGARRLQDVRSNLPLVVFLLTVALAAVFSVGKHASFRELSLLMSLVVLFAAYREASSSETFVSATAGVLVASGFGVAVYGIAQHFGLDIVKTWQDDGISARLRSMATMGNPIYLAAYMAMVGSLALSLFVGSDRRERTLALGAAVCVMLACLLFTQGRAGLLALGVGCAVVLAGNASGSLRAWKRLAYLAVAGCVLFAVAEAAYSRQGQSVVRRAGSALSSSDITVGFRLSMWRAALEMTATRPFFGWGPGTFGIVLPRFTDSDLLARNEPNRAPAKCAHNELLNLASGAGIGSALAWLWFVGTCAWLGAARLRCADGGRRAVTAGMLGVLAAYTAQAMFTPRLTATAFVFWVTAAVLSGQGVPRREAVLSRKARVLGGMLAAAVGVAFIPSIVMPLVSDRYYSMADAYARRGQFEKALDYHILALKYWSANPDNWLGMAQTCYRAGRSPQTQPGPWLAFASMACNGALRLNPNDGFAHALAGSIFGAYAGAGDKASLQDALREYHTAISMYPRLSSLHNGLALVYQNSGRDAEAEMEYKRAIALGSIFGEPEANLAKLLWSRGENRKALELLGKAASKAPELNPYMREIQALQDRITGTNRGGSHERQG
ncbi:MAG: O-antigen ligase family protein [Armatimonadota bacterium]